MAEDAKMVLKLEASRKEQEQLALEAEELTEAEKHVKRIRNHDAIPVADKQGDFHKQIGKGSNRRILPASLLISLASMLWVISQSGVPMDSSIALPVMINHIRKVGLENLLHTGQTDYGAARNNEVRWTETQVSHNEWLIFVSTTNILTNEINNARSGDLVSK